MASLLKDVYSESFYRNLSRTLSAILPEFNQRKFLREIHTASFDQMELKERMRHTTAVLHRFFPARYADTVALIEALPERLRQEPYAANSFPFLFLSDYIETYGIGEFDLSVRAIESVTKFISCEFAVRPFLLRYGKKMIRQMADWSRHEDYRVRRLATEGIRPRLPWAMALPELKRDPAPVLRILENLKNDPHEWVRRSVANNLNDISKDHPELVIRLAQSWSGVSAETDAIIRHGCRTLLKQGHPDMLQHYGLDSRRIRLDTFNILTPRIRVGDSLAFSCTYTHQGRTEQVIRLEYAILYRRQNGSLARKVFKISEKPCLPGASITVHREHSFRPITTRKFYEGEQGLALIINGKEFASGVFDLSAS